MSSPTAIIPSARPAPPRHLLAPPRPHPAGASAPERLTLRLLARALSPRRAPAARLAAAVLALPVGLAGLGALAARLLWVRLNQVAVLAALYFLWRLDPDGGRAFLDAFRPLLRSLGQALLTLTGSAP